MPPYRPVLFAGFGGGLNLRDQPDVVDPAQAIDILNVTLTEKGALKLRDGFDNHTSSELTNRGWTVFPYYESDGTNQLLVGCDTRLEAVATGGTVTASATGKTTSTLPWRFVRFGGPAAECAYAGNGKNTLQKWEGTAWSAPTGTVDGVGARALPKASLLAVMPNTNRLVAGGFTGTADGPNGATTNPSYVYFSDQGAPETWQVTSNPPTTYNNSLQFTPGDGERITAMVTWREFVFVFKESKFFVLYGESTAANGGPVFNYRTVDSGVGCVGANAVCVGRDGVYFLDRTGVYRTTGGEPEQVSGLIDPFFTGRIFPYYQGGVFNHAQAGLASLTWHEERIYCAVPVGASTSNNRILVYDPRYQWWSLYDIPAAGLCSWKISAQPVLTFSYASGLKHIGKHASTYTNDDGTAISGRWQSGWFDFGDPNVKALRELKVWGQGSFRVGMAKDYEASATLDDVRFRTGDVWSDGTDATDVWADGTSSDVWGWGTSISASLVRRAHRGTVFSMQITDLAGAAFQLLRVTNHLREARIPSVKAST